MNDYIIEYRYKYPNNDNWNYGESTFSNFHDVKFGIKDLTMALGEIFEHIFPVDKFEIILVKKIREVH